jgi:hypothetical protein
VSIGPHVFGDDRLGLWIMPTSSPESFTDKLRDRLPRFQAFKPGTITDLFLPREAQPSDMALVRAADYFAHLWTTPHRSDGSTLKAAAFAALTLKDVDRLKPGALEVNVEVDDLDPYLREVHTFIRAKKPNLRLRFNVQPYKGAELPQDLLALDPHLYVIAQAYGGNMDWRASEFDVLLDLLSYPSYFGEDKCSVMYGAHVSPGEGKPRVPALPGWIRRRGSIYQDDLLVNAGYV